MEKTKPKLREKVLRTVMAALIALSGIIGIGTATAGKAYAASGTIEHTGEWLNFYQTDSHTGATWHDEIFAINGNYTFCIDITTGTVAGASYTSKAMDPGMALKIGLYDRYLSQAHPSWSMNTRYGYLQFMIWCEYSPDYVNAYVTPDPDDFWDEYAAAKAFYKDNKDKFEASGTEWHSDSSQNVCIMPKLTELGSLELTKASANKAMTDGNACYSLKGAEYGIYSDKACTDKVGTLTTDKDGYARKDHVKSGDYWVKETKASSGYALDTHVYPVTVSAGKTAKVNGGKVTEQPKSDPVFELVSKADATTLGSVPQGAATLSGAQFTVEWFAGDFASHDAAVESGTTHRAWVFETDSEGFCYFANEYKVSGDAFFYQSDGKTATMPLGTAFITETKAPAGYVLDDGKGGEPKTFVVRITDEGAKGESVYTYNSPVVPDSVQRGDYRLFKEVPTTNDEEDQELTRIPVEGVQFQIINLNDNAVVSPETLEGVGNGGVVCTIVTDENGIASTRSLRPDGWTGSLAYGTYRVHEVIPEDVAARYLDEHGLTLIGVDDWEITVSADGQYDPLQIVANHIPQTPLCIQKVDSTTGNHIPLACSFQILDANDNLVTYTDHMNEKTVDTWTTVSDGHVTLPMKLDEGTYFVHEVEAPEGYVLGTDDVEFTVDEWRTWDEPIVVEYADAPIHAEIELIKVDADGDEMPVAGAEYCVKAAEDIVTGDGTVRIAEGEIVGYVTTDKDGKAQIGDLYLGRYVVYETKSPEGWALDTAEHLIDIESQGQTVPVVVENLTLADEATTVRLLKVSADNPDAVLEGAVFHIWQTDAPEPEPVPVLAATFDAGGSAGLDDEFTTDADGIIAIDHLPHGSFMIEEVQAPAGYVVDEDSQPIAFKVDDQGFIGLDEEGALFSDTLEVTLANKPVTLDISKTDLTGGFELAGAELVLKDSESKVVDQWTSTNEPHRISPILPGKYILTETVAPQGYLLSSETVEIEVLETGDVQMAEMTNDYTKVDISKTDIATGKELPGATLQVIDSDGNVIEKWVSEDKPHRIDMLEPGDYVLREITAPDGYEVAEDVAFTVDATGEIQTVVMKDAATPGTPGKGYDKTGVDLAPIFALIAAGIAAAGGLIGYGAHKRRKSKKEEEIEDGILDSEEV
ncbi:SpaA isopeptide-forming pilin-related protein [Ellagibacter isourolithinifaciens]|uniref:SpaA isopeptide-forming pilin-related protein n=1 Tax=Ellagibacter isourolithinifaciens TaxID=2137581 RepID=UPI003AAD07E4